MSSPIRSLLTDFMRLVDNQPDKVAILDSEGRTLTYRKLGDYIENAQALLIQEGIKPGETVVALLPNAMETLIMFLACLRGGYTYAPLPCTSTNAEVRHWKELTRASMCLLAIPVSTSLKIQITDMDWKVLTISIGGKLNWIGEGTAPKCSGGRLLIGSSGSTGEPKAIVLDSDRLWSAGCAFLRFHQIETSEVRFWNYLPMSYLGGLFNLGLIPLAAGGSIFVDEPFSGKTFLTFWPTVERFDINSLWMVPSILRGLLSLAERVGQAMPRTHVERCFLGTAPVSLQEKQRFSQVFGIEPLENYGLSETTFISSEHIHALSVRKQNGVGSVMPNVELRLRTVETEGDILSEILVRTPYMMLGYLDVKGHLDLPVDEEGFLASGDFGRVAEGQLLITGRRRDIIKKGGILIALREIELLAESSEMVLEAAAVRIDHPFYGESYALYIRVKEMVKDEKLFLSQFSTWLHEQNARHKWPERIILRKNFPRTASGKLQKHLLSAEGNDHE
jgi:acyl-CoA synthetase (AMP-forming)/AMP-acid ligase II